MKYMVWAAVLSFVFIVCPVSAGEKEHFTDYYYSAKNVITDLNALAADIDDAKPSKGLSPASAKSYLKKLAKAREGLENILAYTDSAKEVNEGYISYIDKMTIALSISENYYESKDKATRTKLHNALKDADTQKKAIDAKWRNNQKKFGLLD